MKTQTFNFLEHIRHKSRLPEIGACHAVGSTMSKGLIDDKLDMFCRDSIPLENREQVRDFILDVTGNVIAAGRNKVILRKLFVAVCRFVSLGVSSLLTVNGHRLHPWH